MTRVKNIKITCRTCGTEYEAPVLMSYNSTMGKPAVKPPMCPKCGVVEEQKFVTLNTSPQDLS